MISRYLGQAAVLVLGIFGSVALIFGVGLFEKHPALDQPVAKAIEPLNSAGQEGPSSELSSSSNPVAPLQADALSRTEALIARTAIPSFDVVSVEPTGEVVIAGHTAPGATVDMLRDGTKHASIVADSSGQFALLPPPLPPGPHEIALEATVPDGTRARSRDSVAIVISGDQKAKPLVALTSPGKVAELLSSAQPAQNGTGGVNRTLLNSPLSETQGNTKTASAAPSRREAGEIDRAETHPQGAPTKMVTIGAGDDKKAGSQTGSVLVREVNTSFVSKGDNLWRLSRRIYGSGHRYAVIYEANQQQIRNPNLIYPRQILVLPAQDDRTQ
jgi:LysM domain